jgi:hypothetical protein
MIECPELLTRFRVNGNCDPFYWQVKRWKIIDDLFYFYFRAKYSSSVNDLLFVARNFFIHVINLLETQLVIMSYE